MLKRLSNTYAQARERIGLVKYGFTGSIMDWTVGISRALDYIEDNIREKIDFGAVAREAASSPFHFQRVFGLLCGCTLGDYIRMRRLTLAAEELCRTDKRIIDIALDYGYTTPESFCRAFTRFHGTSPTEVRRDGKYRVFSRLFVKLIITGGDTMNCKIIKLDAFTLACRRKHVNKPEGDTATTDISLFWEESGKSGALQSIGKYGRYDRIGGMLGVCFSNEMDDSGFPYGIGVDYNGRPIEDEGIELVEIPAQTYAVFEIKGKLPEAFHDTYMRICTEFFPQSKDYEYGSGIELEVYPSPDTNSSEYSCETWIAVKEKNS